MYICVYDTNTEYIRATTDEEDEVRYVRTPVLVLDHLAVLHLHLQPDERRQVSTDLPSTL